MFERERDRTQPEEAGATSAFLGKGSRVTGKLVFEGTVRIEGQVEGEIAAQDTLTIGEGALVKAKVVGTSIVVHGHVNGDMANGHANGATASGHVNGDMMNGHANGATANGHENGAASGESNNGAAFTHVPGSPGAGDPA